MGVLCAPLANGQAPKILVVDGETISEAQARESAAQMREVIDGGGLVWIMVTEKGAALENLKELLGAEVVLTNRQATSLVHGKAKSVVESLSLKDLYFAAEAVERRIQKAGLAGRFIDAGTVLLTACDSDWTLFERQPEAAKCASMLLYERLQKPAGASLVETVRGNGKIWMSTLNPAPTGAAFASFWSQLWSCVGVHTEKPTAPTQQKKSEHDLLLDGPPK